MNQWLSKLGALHIFVSDRGTEHPNYEIASLCMLIEKRRSARTPFAPKTNALLEVQQKIGSIHFGMFLFGTPESGQLASV